jgi:hypothetical protein
VGVCRMTVARVRQQFAAEGPRRHPAQEARGRAAEPQARRGAGGPADRPDLLAAPRGAGPLDPGTAGRQVGRVARGRVDRPGDGVAGAEKNYGGKLS